MLTAEQIDNWVDALNSGTYQQSGGRLKSTKGFCCLGVLADTLGCKWDEYNHAIFPGYGNYGAGVPTNVLEDRFQITLMGMNDSGTYNFPQIAAYIKNRLPRNE